MSGTPNDGGAQARRGAAAPAGREPLEVVARELSVTAADLSGWRDAFLEADEASLKSRLRDDRDETIVRLRTKVGELTMDDELLCTRVERLEGGAPFAVRTPAR